MDPEQLENLDSQMEEEQESPDTDSEEAETVPESEYTDLERQLHARLKKEEAKVKKLQAQDDDVVKRSDFEKTNELDARKALEASDSVTDKEIIENWDEIAPVYAKVGSRDKLSKDNVVEDLRDAHVVWSRNRHQAETPKATEADIAAMTGKKSPSPATKEATETGAKIIKRGKTMDSWFPSPE